MRSGLWLLLLLALMMTACNTHVRDPWVQEQGYLKQERTRSPDVAQQLEHRMIDQRDR